MNHRWFALGLLFAGTVNDTPARGTTAAEMCQIIRADIIEYRATGRPCPCPYSILASGKQCGNGAAWAKPDGRVPRCYFGDVTGERPPNRRPSTSRLKYRPQVLDHCLSGLPS